MLTTQTVRTTVHEYTANLSANTLQARATSGRHQRCCCRQCWSKIRCRRCAARKLALRGRPAQERNVEHRAWQDDPASLCARRRLVGCPKNRQEKLIGSRRTARQRHESSSAVVHVVTQKTPVISRSVHHTPNTGGVRHRSACACTARAARETSCACSPGPGLTLLSS